MDMIKRPRRLRSGEALRKMVRETRVSPSALIYPAFVVEGEGRREEIPSMPGQYHYSVDKLLYKAEEMLSAGVDKMMLFGVPGHKDAYGSGAWAEDGVVQRAMRALKERFPELYLVGDVCMCEYTSHGHCGILTGSEVDNDKTLDYLCRIALSQVEAGADMVAPSDMMDGRVGAIRSLEEENRQLREALAAREAEAATLRREKERVAQLELDAQQRAADVLAQAQTQAEGLLDQARREAESLRSEASAQSEGLVSQAREQAQAIYQQMAGQVTKTAGECKEICDAFDSVAAHVASELRRMDVAVSQLPISLNRLREGLDALSGQQNPGDEA